MSHYPNVDPNPNFAELEEKVLKHWQQLDLFEKSVSSRPAVILSEAEGSQGSKQDPSTALRSARNDGANNEFVFYDGPPFANGMPHYGHLLTGYVKDAIARYQTMQGKRVERRFGWDCHGLPAEMGSEKELNISGRQAIQEFGIKNFNEHCRSSVMKYAGEWEYYVDRQARWVDFENDYKTMDKNFMESVLWAFKQLYEKDYIYEAYRVMPYSWAAETPLSNFETKLDNSYREKEDKAATVAFELNEAPKGAPKADKYFVLAWTTTPWTLPSNLALAVGGEVEYCYHIKDGTCYVIGKNALPRYAKELEADPEIQPAAFSGSDLIDLTYKPLFPYFADHPNAFRILDGSAFVTDSDGTGIVHMAPGFGEDDQKTCEANGIELTVPVDGQGRYTDEIFDILPSPCGRADEAKPKAEAESGGGEWAVHPPTAPFPEESRRVERDPTLVEYAKKMRQNPTDAEHKLWNILRSDGFDDWKFRRQEVVGRYIADFISYSKRLVVELDGSQHMEKGNQQYDEKRTTFFTDQGYTVIRFWNHDMLQQSETVAGAIYNINMPPPDSLRSSTLPQGEGNEVMPPLSLKGLNVIAQKDGKCEAEPYTDKQLEKFGLVNLRIINWLKMKNQLIKVEDFKHNYPHCWRTDTPLIYRAMPSWYVAVTKFKDRAVELNREINWIPSHIGPGQMEHMLGTAPDWSISRNRFWGTPIPVWRSKSGKIKVFGSIEELEAASGTKIEDLHRPYIDEIIIEEDGETYERVEDVFDCWFESGSMPFAQVHYPFENKDWFESHFPADFITEYVGQTRGWFNTLIMLSTALFDKPPFKNCICHGVVLDSETGLKYSKRLKNYKDPKEVMDQYGADALRWLMLASPVMRGMDLSVDPEGKFIRDVVRLAIKPIWNAYNFFVMYANADDIKASRFRIQATGEVSRPSEPLARTTSQPPHARGAAERGDIHIMDQYIIAKCNNAVQQIQTSLDAYDTPGACDAVLGFFEVLNNWYIRRSKERFWKEEKDADKQAAYDTLYTVMVDMCRAAAPLLPFTLDEIFQGLTGEDSVHIADFPATNRLSLEAGKNQPLPQAGHDSHALITQMDFAQNVCNAALAVRSKLNIRVRQPLTALTIVSKSHVNLGELASIIEDEVNVKTIHLSTDFDAMASLKLQVNSRVLGKRLPAEMKKVLPASKKGEWKKLDNGNVDVAGIELLAGEFDILLEPNKEYAASAQALSTNDALVILDTEVTAELEAEGYARDLVRMIQQARKDAGLNISDRIELTISGDDVLVGASKTYQTYITEQTLTNSLANLPVNEMASNEWYKVEQSVDDKPVVIALKKVG